MVRMYETVILVQPDLGDDELKGLSVKIQEIIAKMTGVFHRLEDWGLRKLAYPVKKNVRGRYYYLRFDGDAALIAELERRLRLDDRVLRYQSVKLEKEATAPAPKAVAVEAPAEEAAASEGA